MSNLSEHDSGKRDCPNKRDCFEMLQLILDGEATAQQREEFLTRHLEECLPCYRNYHLEMAIRQLLKLKCTSLAPPELVDDIRKKVAQNLSH